MIKVGDYVRATRTSTPFITEGKTYKVTDVSESYGVIIKFDDDRGKNVSCGYKPDWLIKYIHKNLIGGKLL